MAVGASCMIVSALAGRKLDVLRGSSSSWRLWISTHGDEHAGMRRAVWLGRRRGRSDRDCVIACISLYKLVACKEIETCAGRYARILWTRETIVGCFSIYE